MRYVDFRDSIRNELGRHAGGLTWPQLRERLGLPYDRPCPNWVKRMEEESGLVRERQSRGPSVWKAGRRAPAE